MHLLAQPIEMYRPPVLHFGDGTLSKLANWVAANGYSRPFVVADSVNAGRVDRLGLDGPAVFGTVRPEPDIPNLESAVAAAARVDADLVIGFGGGSAMDMAKLVAVMVGQDVSLDDISGPNRAPARRVGLVQIPTTSGTGSEIGTRALIANPLTHAKIATESQHMLADMAIVDPLLTHSVPPAVTAATGIDALAHCVEAYTSRRAHPLIDGYAMQGIELVGRFLKRAVVDGSDAEARAGLSLAAVFGGVCLGPVNTTAGHAVAYPLSTHYGVAHGLANALIFPHTLAANAPIQMDKTRAICQALGFVAETPAEILSGARDFCTDLGLQMTLRSCGVEEDRLPAMAAEAHAIRRLLDWNPADLSIGDIRNIYLAAW